MVYGLVYFHQNKKRRNPKVKIVTVQLCGVRKSLYEKLPTCAAWANRRGEKTREGAKSDETRLERMKRGSGIKGRDDKSSGIRMLEIRMSDVLTKINPTDPLILAKQATRRNLNCSDSSGNSLARAEASR